MFQIDPITGRTLKLPKGILCLTYDDGPGETEGDGAGPKTLRLGEYLATENIRATFFVTGKNAQEFPETVKRLSALGHLIGNHTWNHPDMAAYARKNGDVAAELTRTEKAIPAPETGSPIFFRPPYGEWSREVCQKLNDDDGLRSSHVGPIFWDAGGWDWRYWKADRTPESCAEEYLRGIEGQPTGAIVLQHDHSANAPGLAAKNRTYEMTRQLVPKLKERGYLFARLDELPEMKALARKDRERARRAENGG